MALLPDYEDQVIKEGFLCPVCLEDFPGINELQAHFTSGIHDEKQDADADDVESVSSADGSFRSRGIIASIVLRKLSGICESV